MIKRIHRQALFILIPLAIASAFIEPKKLPISILIGGILALLNFRGMSRGLENLIGTYKPAMKLMFLSLFRLFIVSAIIVVLAVLKAVNLIGLAAGFTVVLTLLLIEGFRSAQREGGDGPPEQS